MAPMRRSGGSHGARPQAGIGTARSCPGRRSDRGAAAVEFAIVFPLMLLIVFATIDFGRALFSQVTLTQAAREGARVEAMGLDGSEDRAVAAAAGLSEVAAFVDGPCPGGEDAIVIVEYTFEFVTPVGAMSAMFDGGSYGDPIVLSAEGVMPCEV